MIARMDPSTPPGTGPPRSGVLLHVGSLPGGRLGPEAYRFVDWLAQARQSWWQILPLGPPNRHGSPYEALSAFAAWPGFLAEPDAPVGDDEVEAFRRENAAWAGDWERFAGPGAVANQLRFAREWDALRRYAAEGGVRILGDMPIYVAPGSADVRAHPDLFIRDEVGGVPPDYFSEDGQLWNSPLYDWRVMRRQAFGWWIERVRRALALVDAVRIDHFRGLVAYWAVPKGARTARTGRWRRAPGRELLAAIESALGRIPIVAEDLGVITPAVDRLRTDHGLPGMMVLQFELGSRPVQRGRLWGQADRIAYPGTHDNATVAEWHAAAGAAERRNLAGSLRIAGIDETDPVRGMIRLAHHAPARLAVIAAQDILGLGAEARMNVPSRARGNWRWQLRPGQLTGALAEWLAQVTVEAGRAP